MVPDQIKSILWGYPTAKGLTFSKDHTQIEVKPGRIVAPNALLNFVNNTNIGNTSRRLHNVDVVWPAENCLVRTVTLPKASLAQYRKMLRLDMLQSTPFTEAEVFWCFDIDAAPDGKTTLLQYIVKRVDIQKFSNCSLGYGLQVRNVYLAKKSNAMMVLDNTTKLSAPARIWNRINTGLGIAIIGLAATMVYLPHVERSNALADINARISGLSQQAVSLRNNLTISQETETAKLVFLDDLTSRPLIIAHIEELTKRLPDKVWLQSLSFQKATFVLSGVIDGSAAELVLALGQSTMIKSPRLSGAVSKTGDGDQERFQISFETTVPTP